MQGKDGLRLNEGVTCNVSRRRDIEDPMPLKGLWTTEHWRQRKSGLYYMVDKFDTPNTITYEAKVKLFNTMFNADGQTNLWYCGLINASGFSGHPATDTMAVKGWTEWIAYNEGTRRPWGQGAAASPGAITNVTPMVFTINGVGGIVQGLFLTTLNGFNVNTGLLWSAQSYASPVTVVANDQIRSSYSVSA